MPQSLDEKREFLRHTVATLAYRGRKALVGVGPEFGAAKFQPGCRAPLEILAHVGDLLDWALSLCRGRGLWQDSVPKSWNEEVVRFFAALQTLDAFLASDRPLGCPTERLFQGPIADALTHIGQIAMCRRLTGALPVRGENYFVAEIKAGQVGLRQEAPLKEFD
ncbi:MAG: hypothetical protein EHM23_22715 [Acidobacteria bacterium]|nr:MAG: hypothetical protein EHM23_22715 [Acidobacteriota bacterium]